MSDLRIDKIDWSKHDQYPKDECECICGTSFMSHSKFIMSDKPALLSREPCPSCGKHDIRGSRSSPETFTI